MNGSTQTDAVLEFYNTHPISEGQILAKLETDKIGLEGLSEDILQNYDQDHYGGVAANDRLASLASMKAGQHVLDICCGLGGPARYYAHNFGCRVTGIDLTQSRIDGARRLSALTNQSEWVEFVCANALDMPFDDASFDIGVSQEAFCHIPEGEKLLAECARVLKPGGRLVFTDVLSTDRSSRAILDRLQREMTFCELIDAQEYIHRLERVGFRVDQFDDLGSEWQEILTHRLAMYRSLEDQTVNRFGQAHFKKWDSAYSFFVGRFSTGELSGGRFLATRLDDCGILAA